MGSFKFRRPRTKTVLSSDLSIFGTGRNSSLRTSTLVELSIETTNDGNFFRWIFRSIDNFLFELSFQKEIQENYERIQMKPNEFVSYLLSSEVGFESCRTIATPDHTQKGSLFFPNGGFFLSKKKTFSFHFQVFNDQYFCSLNRQFRWTVEEKKFKSFYSRKKNFFFSSLMFFWFLPNMCVH